MELEKQLCVLKLSCFYSCDVYVILKREQHGFNGRHKCCILSAERNNIPRYVYSQKYNVRYANITCKYICTCASVNIIKFVLINGLYRILNFDL